MQKDSEQAGARPSRISVWRLGKNLLLALVFPCTVAVAVDRLTGTWPILTLLVAGFAFPIAGFVVMRSALQEMEKVIQEIAPAETDDHVVAEDAGEEIDA